MNVVHGGDDGIKLAKVLIVEQIGALLLELMQCDGCMLGLSDFSPTVVWHPWQSWYLS